MADALHGSSSLMSTSLHVLVPEMQPAALEGLPLEQILAQAFSTFNAAASSLECAYVQLQAEARRLRHELEVKNCDLAHSLEENRRMRQHLDRILEGLPCGVLVMELAGNVSFANPEAGRLLGAVSDAAIDSLNPLPVWIAELLTDASSGNEEHEYCCRQGGVEAIAVKRAQLAEDNGGSSIFILQDRTASKRLEKEHEALRRRQALAEMAALLAHEIRNPLGSLELFAGLLAGSDLDPEPRRWIEQLQAGLRLLSATANNVLHFYSAPELHPAPLDLGPWLQTFVQFLEPLAARARVRVELAAQLDGVVVAADRHRLEQVMLNLALNAFRVMGSGGTLTFSGGIELPEGQRPVCVRIRDNGPGIASADLERIFETGFSTHHGCTGLGLLVAKAIVEQHGGTIEVSSRAGHGTTFTLSFPLSKEAQ